MFIEDLDRHQWSFREARLHVARLILRQIELAGTPPSHGQGAAPQWYRSGDPVQQAQEIARRELLIALKDGDLHAMGRLSVSLTAMDSTARIEPSCIRMGVPAA